MIKRILSNSTENGKYGRRLFFLPNIDVKTLFTPSKLSLHIHNFFDVLLINVVILYRRLLFLDMELIVFPNSQLLDFLHKSKNFFFFKLYCDTYLTRLDSTYIILSEYSFIIWYLGQLKREVIYSREFFSHSSRTFVRYRVSLNLIYEIVSIYFMIFYFNFNIILMPFHCCKINWCWFFIFATHWEYLLYP